MKAGKRKAEDEDFNVLAGPSSLGASGPEPKAKRRKKVPNTLPVAEHQGEKRLARFKSSCPKNIMERVDRVMTQRFFMIDRKRNEEEHREEFKVLGSTGNVYNVVIDKLPSCNCPDATKGNHCKHILFIFLKVLSVPISSTLYYQKALLSTELQTLFAQAPVAPNSLQHPRLQAAYAKAIGRSDEAASLESTADEAETKKKRLPGEEDDCPICYETMYKVSVEHLTFCSECGNALHNECFQQWANTAKTLTCVWCRAQWPSTNTVNASSSTAPDVSEGYLNLGAVAGISPVRDTGSYYNGPRRGQPWGVYNRRYYQ